MLLVESVMNENEQIIREFVAAWSNLNAAELVDYFAEDGVYYNMPAEPVQGKDNLQGFIGGFIGNWSSTDWIIVNLLADGDLVMVERLDKTRVGDKEVDLPCFGIFEMEQGKIKVWRDYFDMNTYIKALS
jgi:limonene-1,2-epoxide hydrolase